MCKLATLPSVLQYNTTSSVACLHSHKSGPAHHSTQHSSQRCTMKYMEVNDTLGASLELVKMIRVGMHDANRSQQHNLPESHFRCLPANVAKQSSYFNEGAACHFKQQSGCPPQDSKEQGTHSLERYSCSPIVISLRWQTLDA
jgi:hypothetical protein